MMTPSCYVIMGYGVKTDFQQNKTFDLDKSYKYMIKPAVEAAGYTCERADEVQHAGLFDVPMYDRLLTADLVIADLSTANMNAFFELGVRYALRPRSTIVIAEKGFRSPFDMGHVPIRSYEHLGTGIDYGEIERFRAELTEACRAVAQGNAIDSPVYTFLTDLAAPERRVAPAAAAAAPAMEEERQQRTREALAHAKLAAEKTALSGPFATLMASAMEARANEDFVKMRDILTGIRAAQGAGADPFVVQQLAFATYKAGQPDRKTALFAARSVLQSLDPEGSSDPETLHLWGTIHEHLWEFGGLTREERSENLDIAIEAYERCFLLMNHYRSGNSFAFLLSARAAERSGEEAIADRVQARRARHRVLKLCEVQLAAGIRGESAKVINAEQYWIRATMAEALFGLGRTKEGDFALATAQANAPEPWMITTTDDQIAKLKRLLPTP